MDTSSMKNIVILKDLPSNLVEEAIVFLKENQKLKKPELVDSDAKSSKEKLEGKHIKTNKPGEYIISEAQMLIAEYISKIENKDKEENSAYKKLKKKYKILKKVSTALAICLVASIFLLFKI